MNKIIKRLYQLFFLISGLSHAQSESDFTNYYDSINDLIVSKAYDQFQGDLQELALNLIDTLEITNHPIKDCFLSETYAHLALSYTDVDMKKAKSLMDKSLVFAQYCDNSFYIISAYNSLAIYHGSAKDKTNLDSVAFYFQKAEEMSVLHNNDTILTDIFMNLARCFLYQKKNTLFKEYIEKSKSQFIPGGDSARVAVMYELWADFYKNNDNDKVLPNYELSIEWAPRANTGKKITITSKMMTFCRSTKQYKLALKYYDKLYQLRRFEQIKKFNERYDNLIDKHDIQKSKDRIAQIELEKKYIQQASNEKHKWNILLTCSLILLLIGLLFYFRLYRNQQKLSTNLNVKNLELEKAKEAALELVEAKTRFTDTISHELRTPLHGIIGLTSLLIDKERANISDEGKPYLDNLKYSGEYLLTLINDVLEMSKIDSKAIQLEDKSFHLQFFISNLSSTFKNLVVESNNEFTIEVDSNIPKYIKGDPIRLSQILINLIGNALKFTKNGLVELKVSHVQTKSGTVRILFAVHDNGPGISPNKQELIFDKFIQIKNDSSILNGTGLGLPIVKELLQLFNSNIQLESTVGEGTKFFFEIDFNLGQEDEVENLEIQQTLNSYGFEQGKILIVDDNEINLIVSKKLLENDGYSTETCFNGLEALKILEKESFDLILMDLHMPKMDGLEAVQQIRKTNVNVPIVLITASNITDKWNEYKDNGFDDYIIKPYDKYDFLKMAMKHLNHNKKVN